MLNEVMQKASEGKWLLIALSTCVVITLLVLRVIIHRSKTKPSLSSKRKPFEPIPSESNEDPNSLFKSSVELLIGLLIGFGLFLAGATTDKKLFQWSLMFYGSVAIILTVDRFSSSTFRPNIKNIIFLVLAAVFSVVGQFAHIFSLRIFLSLIGMSLFCIFGVRMLKIKALEDSESEADKS